jgi:hypothetical protein
MANFLNLPTELQKMIYEPLLISHHPIPIHSSNLYCTENFPALALVSKKRHDQASIVFYSQNTFIIGNLRSGLGTDPDHSIRKLLSFVIMSPCFMDNIVCEVEDRVERLKLRWIANLTGKDIHMRVVFSSA